MRPAFILCIAFLHYIRIIQAAFKRPTFVDCWLANMRTTGHKPRFFSLRACARDLKSVVLRFLVYTNKSNIIN